MAEHRRVMEPSRRSLNTLIIRARSKQRRESASLSSSRCRKHLGAAHSQRTSPSAAPSGSSSGSTHSLTLDPAFTWPPSPGQQSSSQPISARTRLETQGFPFDPRDGQESFLAFKKVSQSKMFVNLQRNILHISPGSGNKRLTLSASTKTNQRVCDTNYLNTPHWLFIVTIVIMYELFCFCDK